MISTVGLSGTFLADTTEGRTECCVGVRGEESTTESGETSELVGEAFALRGCRSAGKDVKSEPVDCVTSEAWRECARTVVEGAPPGSCVFAGLAVFVLGGGGGGGLVRTGFGDFARMVLGWELVVDVRSVMSASPSLMLDLEMLGVRRELLSTLCLPEAISLCSASAFRRMLFTLAVFLRSAPLVAVSGGLGGALVGLGGDGVDSLPCCCSPASVDSGVDSSRLYMFSFACVLLRVGYDRLEREPFSDEAVSELLRSSSGMPDLCDTSSLDSLLERGLRDDRDDLLLLCRSLSLSLSRSFSRSRSRSRSLDFGLLRSRSGSFLRRRCGSDGLDILCGRGGVAAQQTSCGAVLRRRLYDTTGCGCCC